MLLGVYDMDSELHVKAVGPDENFSQQRKDTPIIVPCPSTSEISSPRHLFSHDIRNPAADLDSEPTRLHIQVMETTISLRESSSRGILVRAHTKSVANYRLISLLRAKCVRVALITSLDVVLPLFVLETFRGAPLVQGLCFHPLFYPLSADQFLEKQQTDTFQTSL